MTTLSESVLPLVVNNILEEPDGPGQRLAGLRGLNELRRLGTEAVRIAQILNRFHRPAVEKDTEVVGLLRYLEDAEPSGGVSPDPLPFLVDEECLDEDAMAAVAHNLVEDVRSSVAEIEPFVGSASTVWQQVVSLVPTVEPASLRHFGQNIDALLVFVEIAGQAHSGLTSRAATVGEVHNIPSRPQRAASWARLPQTERYAAVG